ncbi:MAG: hypothetical protein KF770_08735 [Anaerolineae bacterium]|nr:hypothetical protein [Anaerolineae bacterium]
MSLGSAHLWVEGKNDFHVIAALCHYHHVLESFAIVTPETMVPGAGVDAVFRAFRYSLMEADKRAVGLVVDADQDVDGRWQQVITIVNKTNQGYSIPPSPALQGTIIPAPSPELPRIGVWLMPDNTKMGMVEDFAAMLLPTNDKLQTYAAKVLSEIEAAGLNGYLISHHSKAFIHTWLAWQENPGMPMGQAITAKTLSPESPIAHQFVDWLNRLFN